MAVGMIKEALCQFKIWLSADFPATNESKKLTTMPTGTPTTAFKANWRGESFMICGASRGSFSLTTGALGGGVP
jgi:hypothetical protein